MKIWPSFTRFEGRRVLIFFFFFNFNFIFVPSLSFCSITGIRGDDNDIIGFGGVGDDVECHVGIVFEGRTINERCRVKNRFSILIS